MEQKIARREEARGGPCGDKRAPKGDGLVQQGPAEKAKSNELGRGLQESTQTSGSSLLITEKKQQNKTKRRRKRADLGCRDYAGPKEGTGGARAPPAIGKTERGGWLGGKLKGNFQFKLMENLNRGCKVFEINNWSV